jgi:hypothetical protein
MAITVAATLAPLAFVTVAKETTTFRNDVVRPAVQDAVESYNPKTRATGCVGRTVRP